MEVLWGEIRLWAAILLHAAATPPPSRGCLVTPLVSKVMPVARMASGLAVSATGRPFHAETKILLLGKIKICLVTAVNAKKPARVT